MTQLNLSHNRIENVQFLNKLPSLTSLYINNNQIKTFELEIDLKYLTIMDISFNNDLNEFDKVNKIDKMLNKVFINLNLIDYFNQMSNKMFETKKQVNIYYPYLESINLITKDNLEYLDCYLTFDFLKRNINLNLFFTNQINSFLDSCHLIDIDY